ncbi:hypothetical protein EGL67_25075 [Vibrio parahaemolyticus]|uniref:hypothetical protein n=1 Tax=Vibrio parahaemolyticus TaxID=670 RepID=UPI00100F0E77|nr:hypothetical protein [Vibrio parahaemolyticus]RXP53096.1 hypothetical protein EGL72_25175 [Vibrio parahaemolyticus]RXP65332.1 hypothetical protein EGL71_25370 [Vibrio parahaemolyticus]RXP91016.1 hypothetical protein EGL68_25545 [Vibrio parahaemolyticus]RXQ11531.1 hypothetical protein EGL65_25480 [Vibrio parahaemolyticus]RXQ23318.1 hypothetical protein EGL67_25075 [Vibrio parahaemolyticus]
MRISELTTKDITIECDYTQVDAVDAYMRALHGSDLIKERHFQPPGKLYHVLVYKVYTSMEMTDLCAQDPTKATERYMGNQTRSQLAPSLSPNLDEKAQQAKEGWLKSLIRRHYP